MLHVEHGFPSAFSAPHRWTTADGCMPYAVCWAYFSALEMCRAGDALCTAHGIGIAFAGDDGADVADRAVHAFLPPGT